MADVNWPYMMRRQSTAAWWADTVALLDGEPGKDITLGVFAIGDGSTLWPALPKFTPGGDADAIHDNVAGEIALIAEKTTPVYGDWLLVEDSEATNAKKKVAAGAIVEQLVLNASTSDRNMLEATGGGAPVRVKGLKSGDGIEFSSVTGNVRGDLKFSAANKYWYGGTAAAPTEATINADGRALLAAADYAAMRALLDLEIGTDAQAYSAVLDQLALVTAPPVVGYVRSNTDGTFEVRRYSDVRVDLDAGNPNGLATLDGSGYIPTSQLPASIVGQVEYQGTWSASANSPAIPAAAAGNKGHFYITTTAVGSGHGYANVPAVDFAVGDWIISDGTSWSKVDNTDAVATVAGRTGAVVLTSADLTDRTTLGANWFTMTTPGGVRFARINADGSITQRTAAELVTDLALTIGTNTQAWSGVLDTLAGASANGQSLVTAANYAAMRTLLTLVPGTDVHAYDAELAAIAGLASAANKAILFTGSGTATLIDLVLGTEVAYSGTATWTAGAAPSGTTNVRQFYTRVGNEVTWTIVMTYGTAGTTVTNLSLTFPSEFPTPAIPTGFTGGDVRIWNCDSARFMATPTSTGVTAVNTYFISRNAADNGFVIAPTAAFTSSTVRQVTLSGVYFTS